MYLDHIESNTDEGHKATTLIPHLCIPIINLICTPKTAASAPISKPPGMTVIPQRNKKQSLRKIVKTENAQQLKLCSLA